MLDNKRILIVDDEPRMLETLRDVFNELEYEADTAVHGVEALELLKKTQYDIAILDIVMPKMNGVELFALMKKEYPGTKVVMITGYGNNHPIVEAVLADKDATLLYKPYLLSELIEVVRSR